MKRFDFALLVVLASFAAFVGVEARRTRSESHERSSHGEADARLKRATLPRAARAKEIESTEVAGRAASSKEEVLKRVRERGKGTFIHDVIAAHDSALARWPDRLTNPLRVWVQSGERYSNWSEERLAVVRDAFTVWAEVGLPLNFIFVADSVSADVVVSWTDRFNEPISGKTLWAHNDGWWIVDASIQLALHHRDGVPLDLDATRAIALHEVGHLIGLDHTGDSTSIMTPRVRVKELSIADRSTAYLLYSLPPGPLGASTRARKQALGRP
ncbi:MAG: matrixin family metalloprotease [Gemmatimonadaceae bacterium]